MEIRSNVRKGSDVINLIKLGIKDIMIYLGVIKIYPIIPINDAIVTCDSAVYNRNNQVAQNIIVTLNGTTLVEYRDYVVSANAGGTNVGTYTVTVKGIDNYGGTANGTFIITKAPPTYTAPTAKTLTYTGSPQALLNGGYSSDGIIQYSTDNSTWSASIPTGTNTNTYITYWRFIGEGGNFYDKSSESISTTISKANQAAPIATGATTTYNNPAVATASGGGGHGTLEWTNGTTQSSIGSKTTKARWSGDSNYNASPYSNEVTVTMNKMAGVVTINGVSTSYDGNSKALATVSGNSGTMHYSTDQTNWSTSIPTSINAGSWRIYWYMDGTDYYYGIEASSSRYVSSSIAKINQVAPTATGASVTYGNTATATATGGGGYGTLEWSNGNTLTGNVGSKTTKARWSGNTNYNPSDYSNEVTLAITRANLSNPSVSMNNWTYGNTASTPSVSGNSGNGTVTYSYKVSTAADSTYTSTKPSNAGTYTVRAVIGQTTNYNGATVTTNFTISKANLSSASVSMTGWEYGSTASNPSVSGNSGGGSVTYSYKVSTAADSTYTSIKPSTVGTYTVRAIIAETSNYNGATLTNTFSISKKNLSNVSVSISGWTYGDTASTPSVSGNIENGSVTYSYKINGAADSTYSSTKPSNAGTYVVRAVIAETTNYNGTTVTNTFTIAKADQSAPTATGSTVTYGNTATATATGGGSHGTLEWNNGNTLTGNVGSKVTKVRWSGDSNYKPSPYSNEVTLAITKANQSAPSVTGATTTYPTTATASASGGGGQGSIEWESAQSQSSVGSHTTRARWTGNSNYNASPWSGYVTVSMGKASQSAPTASGSSVTLGSSACASASGGGGQGSIEWSNGQCRTATGSQSTQARWSGNGNYDASPWSNSVTLTVTDPYNGHTYTDLGLSVNWATTNLGASDPHDIGSFYKYGLGANTYSNSQADYEGREDPLDASVDSATQTWGPHWRTPTEAEWIEFANNCTFETIIIDGQEYLRCHANNTYIDLPVTGYYEDGAYDDNSRGYYWTSSPNGSAEAFYARCNGNITTYRDARKCGFLIRPVAV